MSSLGSVKAYTEGDCESSIFAMGQSAGLVREIKSVGEVVKEIVEQARQVGEKMHGYASYIM